MVRTAITGLICGVLLLGGCTSRHSVKVDSSSRPRKASHIVFGSGSGESPERAVKVIGAQSQRELVNAEEDFISRTRGNRGKNWRIVGRSSLREGSRVYDVVEIEVLPEMTRDYFYFDITGSAWKPR